MTDEEALNDWIINVRARSWRTRYDGMPPIGEECALEEIIRLRDEVAALHESCVRVPAEPTANMIAAAMIALGGMGVHCEPAGLVAIYRAMIAARPQTGEVG